MKISSHTNLVVKRRKFLTIAVSAGIGLTIPSLIDYPGNNKAEAAIPALAVLLTLTASLPVLSKICGVDQKKLEQKLAEVKKYYSIANNSSSSTIAVGKKLLKKSNNAKTLFDSQQWDEQQANYYINGLFGEKVNQSEEPKLKLWQMNTEYKVGEIVAFQEKRFKCIQSHTTYAPNWTPSIHTRALWEPIS
jgi:hypothetical protein